MNIKDFFSQEKASPEAYWALVLEPGFVQAGIWYIKDQKSEVVDVSPVSAWEEEEELVGAVDASLSSCIQKLPEELDEPTKTVFGVSSSWVEGGEIKRQYLDLIEKICGQLSLTPVGFVVLAEAVSHYYKSVEGVPLNAIVIGLRSQELEISLFKTGDLEGTTQVARSVSVVDDCLEGLTRISKGEPLPSRIIVYNGKGGELEEAKNSLSGHTWESTDKVKFLHPPKVEVLDSEKKVTATAFAGATEMGGVLPQTQQDQVVSKDDESKEDKIVDTAPSTSPIPMTKSEEIPQSNFGFEVSEEVSRVEPKVFTTSVQQPSHVTAEPKPDYLKEIKKYMIGIWLGLSGRSSLLLIILGAIFAAIIAFWWFYPKATVTVFVSPKSFEEEFDITFPSSEVVEVSVSGEKTKSTSGVKLIGERAKGSVQIRNGTALDINVKAGTVLVSGGDLAYTVDSSASVSAAISPGTPGTATTQVSADSIGAEYNLVKDEVFKVGNYPKAEVDAVATADFTGGSSREISAVSQEDREKLTDELTTELLEKAKSDLGSKAGADDIFVSDLAAFEEESSTFSNKVGDEADNLKLNLSMNAKGIITNRAKLATSVREKLLDKIPDGFVLRDSQISYEFAFVEEDGGDFVYKVTAKVNFLPEINQEELIKKISGRTPEVVESYLTSIPGFSSADIKLKPRFPGKFGTLPRVAKHITIEIASE